MSGAEPEGLIVAINLARAWSDCVVASGAGTTGDAAADSNAYHHPYDNGNTDLVRNGTHACHPEGVLARQMDRWDAGQFQKKKLIIISHSPPYGTLDFAVRFGSRNIGSRPLRQFLDSSPNSVLCVCGHVHRCGGQAERIGKTLVVNASSHDSVGERGKVAIIQIKDDNSASVEWHVI